MKEKNQSQMIVDQTFKQLCFNMIFRTNANKVLKKQTNVASYIINIVINLIIFLCYKQINIISQKIIIFGIQVYIVFLSLFGFILFQFFICLFYKCQFYLSIQFKLIRFVIFPFGVIYLFSLISSNSSISLILPLIIVLALIIFIINILFGSQSYTDNYIYSDKIPISSAFLFAEVIFYSLQAIQSRRLGVLLSFIMLSFSIILKQNFFQQQSQNNIQQKILSINCFLYFIYSSIILISKIGDNQYIIFILYMIVPIVLYYIGSIIFKKKIVTIDFKRIFNADALPFQQFIIYAQYLIQEASIFNNSVHANFCESLIFNFYSEHQKYCQRTNCKFFSQNWKEQFKNISDPKILKKITQKVTRKLENLFQQVAKNEPQNINLKFSFIKFYIGTLPNKIRVIQLISEVQTMNKTLIIQYEIYKVKALSDSMDNIEVIDNLKTDDQVNKFQKIAYMTINSMIQFWLQFSEQKIDLSKVKNTSQRVLSYKKQMQKQWQKNKNQEKYSTLKIVLLYSYYLRYVLHDDEQADYLQFFSKTLEQKLLHKKQIKYLSFGSQSALIGASLTDDNLGKIVIANNQASNVFNYSKNQINRIGLNQIMPKIFAQQHDHYLMEFHKNKFKRINSDERLLFGKDKFGHVIPILLQLQRTISSMSQQLLFVANIKKFKVKQTPLICITDQEGQISDVSSGFREVFYQKKEQDKRKIEIPTKNVQEIIPTFFEKNQPQDCGNYKFTEKFYNQKYGQFTVQFTVIPIVFPLKPNGGFVVMGSRQIPYQSLPLNYLNITKQIDSRISKHTFQAKKILYNPQKNRYEFDNFFTKSHGINTCKDEIFTIPFININDVTNIFNLGKQEVNYGDKIRIVRLVQGGGLVRVQDNNTFQSQEMSQTQKVTRFQFKLKQLKYQYLQDTNNLLFVSIGRIFIIFIFALFIFIFIQQTQLLRQQTSSRQHLLNQVKFRFQVRGYLSEYILSFKGLESAYNNVYFYNKTQSIQHTLINVIQGADIAQTAKQPILKVVYLKDQSDLRNLITSEVLSFIPLNTVNVSDIRVYWIIYMTMIGVYFVFQILIKFIHSKKIHNVYHVFLGVDEKMIKKSYESCMKFSKMLEQTEGQQRKEKKRQPQDFEEQNENPVSRMKKYKQDSEINLIILIKYYFSFIIIMIACGLISIMMQNDVQVFNKQYTLFSSLYGLFPESSIALMNSYFKSYKLVDITIDETFNTTYQNMDSIILQFQKYRPTNFEGSFFQTLMNNACKDKNFSLSSYYVDDCQKFQQSIFLTGLDKTTNYISQQIQNININIAGNTSMDKRFFDLFQLQYDFYIPMISSMSSIIFNHMIEQKNTFENTYKVWMGVITLIVALNSFYIYQFLLKQIKDEIELSKELLYLIPDSFIEDKTKVHKKKRSDMISQHKIMNSQE